LHISKEGAVHIRPVAKTSNVATGSRSQLDLAYQQAEVTTQTMALNDCSMDNTEDYEEHTGISPEMEAAILDDCAYCKEYHDFLECFKECGGNLHTTGEQILKRMKDAEKPACLLESSMSSFSRGKSSNMYKFSVV